MVYALDLAFKGLMYLAKQILIWLTTIDFQIYNYIKDKNCNF